MLGDHCQSLYSWVLLVESWSCASLHLHELMSSKLRFKLRNTLVTSNRFKVWIINLCRIRSNQEIFSFVRFISFWRVQLCMQSRSFYLLELYQMFLMTRSSSRTHRFHGSSCCPVFTAMAEIIWKINSKRNFRTVMRKSIFSLRSLKYTLHCFSFLFETFLLTVFFSHLL